jgi:predicted short-subunit dehydrogenase-like oxidoreductase (DUF2520 family)
VTTRTPNTFLVGAGPVATALAGAMRLGGVPVLGLWARKAPAARSAGAIAGVASFSAAPPDLLLEADAVILAVRDGAIAEVAQMLVATGLITRRHVLIHCSGAMSSAEAFAAVRDQIGGVATLHPLRAIADARTAMRTLKGTVVGIEGDERGRGTAQALASAMGGTPLELASGQMAAYHAAAAMASNFVVALLDAAQGAMTSAGVPAEDARAALVALAQGAVANVGAKGVDAGLTGPIRRGDLATVTRHIQALQSPTVAPDLVAIYRVLGRRTLTIARRLGEARPADLDAIEAVLADGAPAGASGSAAGSAEPSVSGAASGEGEGVSADSRGYQA